MKFSELVAKALRAFKGAFNSNAADKLKAKALGSLESEIQRKAMELHRRADDAPNPLAAQTALGDARYHAEMAAKAFRRAGELL